MSNEVDQSSSSDGAPIVQEAMEYPLKRLRMLDFERMQLQTLRAESRAAQFWLQLNRVIRWITQGTRSKLLRKQIPEKQYQERVVVWHDHDSFSQQAWIALQPWVVWFVHYYGNLVRDVLRHPRKMLKSVFTDLISWVYLALVGPFLLVSVGVASLGAWLFPSLVQPVEDIGTSLIYNESLNDDILPLIKQAKAELGSSSEKVPIFSQALAEFLVIVSAVAYISRYEDFHKAEKIYRAATVKDEHALPQRPYLEPGTDLYQKIEALLDKSERRIGSWSNNVGLDYCAVSELGTGHAGPTAYMFWNQDEESENQFLIVAIKGTGLINVNEWLVDCALQKVRVDKEFFAFSTRKCYAHEGFYRSLFPDRSGIDSDWLKEDLYDFHPARTIEIAIKTKAKELRERNPGRGKIPLWLTGHSLGAAVATLLFAYLNVKDLNDDVELRDAYTFGTPMSTNCQFVSKYRGHVGPKKLSRQLWRVINDHDLITYVPLSAQHWIAAVGVGELEPDTSAANDKTNVLNYASIGHGIRYSSQPNIKPKGLYGFSLVCDVPPVEVNQSKLYAWLTSSKLSLLRGILLHSPESYLPHIRQARGVIQNF